MGCLVRGRQTGQMRKCEKWLPCPPPMTEQVMEATRKERTGQLERPEKGMRKAREVAAAAAADNRLGECCEWLLVAALPVDDHQLTDDTNPLRLAPTPTAQTRQRHRHRHRHRTACPLNRQDSRCFCQTARLFESPPPRQPVQTLAQIQQSRSPPIPSPSQPRFPIGNLAILTRPCA